MLRHITKILAAAYLIQEGVNEQQLPRTDMQYHLLVAASENLRNVHEKLFQHSALMFDVWGSMYSKERELKQALTKSATSFYFEHKGGQAKKADLSAEGKQEMLQQEAFVKEIILVVARKGAVKAREEEGEGGLNRSETAGANSVYYSVLYR